MAFVIDTDYLTLEQEHRDSLCFDHQCFDTSWSIYKHETSSVDVITHAREALAGKGTIIPPGSITTLILFGGSRRFRDRTVTSEAMLSLGDLYASSSTELRRKRVDDECRPLRDGGPEFKANAYRGNLFRILLEWYPQLTAADFSGMVMAEMAKVFMAYWPSASHITLIYGAELPDANDPDAPLTHVGPMGIDVTLKPTTAGTLSNG